MSEQAAKDIILGKTLRTLIERLRLTPAEVAQIRLSHLFLAGKSPSINFTPEGSQEAKVVTLDMESHRALVNWLVNRPDSVGDFLFPGQGAEAMAPAEIQQTLEKVEELPSESESAIPKPTHLPEVEGPPPPEPRMDPGSRPVRPFSRPEMGPPPPDLGATSVSFGPPPTAPEEETAAAAIPTSRSKPPPVPPARPVAPPPRPPEPLSVPASASKPVPVTKKEEPKQTPDADLTMVSATKPEIKKEAEAKADRPTTKPEEKTVTPPLKREEVKVGQPAMAAKRDRPIAQQMVTQRPAWARFLLPGMVVIALLLCGGCLVGGWFAAQSEAGSQLLASLGWSSDTTPAADEADMKATEDALVFESVLPTPTLPPTSTPTAAPPTNTPAPTDTATPLPTDTPTPAVTDTPTPTDTPSPTDTPEAEEEPAAASTPTPGLKYPAPEIVEPADGFAFIYGNTIVLRWKPVNLAPDERYAVRLVYRYQGQPTYQGTDIKEPEWIVPLDFFGKIDGPDNLYEWFVVVERANEDGSGTAISPESQHRTFTWR